jgi:hypothetical protein
MAHSYYCGVKFKIYAMLDGSVEIVKEDMWQSYVQKLLHVFTAIYCSCAYQSANTVLLIRFCVTKLMLDSYKSLIKRRCMCNGHKLITFYCYIVSYTVFPV